MLVSLFYFLVLTRLWVDSFCSTRILYTFVLAITPDDFNVKNNVFLVQYLYAKTNPCYSTGGK